MFEKPSKKPSRSREPTHRDCGDVLAVVGTRTRQVGAGIRYASGRASTRAAEDGESWSAR